MQSHPNAYKALQVRGKTHYLFLIFGVNCTFWGQQSDEGDGNSDQLITISLWLNFLLPAPNCCSNASVVSETLISASIIPSSFSNWWYWHYDSYSRVLTWQQNTTNSQLLLWLNVTSCYSSNIAAVVVLILCSYNYWENFSLLVLVVLLHVRPPLKWKPVPVTSIISVKY